MLHTIWSKSVLATVLLGAAAIALPENRTDNSFDAVVDKGTFQDPSVQVRPKFRYWIPDASVDSNVVASDVRGAKDVGAGGLELLGYYLYGGPPTNGAGRGTFAPVDWTKYGFGTEAWYDVNKNFAQAHLDNDLIADFALGPNQGTGVPADIDNNGLSWDLAAFNISVPIKGSFNGTLPGWGMGKLQAAVTGTALSSKAYTAIDPAGGLFGDLPSARTQVTLAADSLTDVTDQVDKNGHLSIDFSSSNSTGLNHTIFAIYLIRSDYPAQDPAIDLGSPQTPAQDFVHNGSWSVDHFSATGAKVTTDFWEKYILQNGTKELLGKIGNYLWEDSVEIEANVYWTQNFSSLFQDKKGYSINKYLPILFHRNGHAKNSQPSIWWVTDEADQGNKYIVDYRDTLATGYHAYETALSDWARNYLSMQFSAQLSYNLPMDMLANIPTVDAPETESLDFSDLIDGYRQYSGPANLARRRIVSSECGAVRGEGVTQTLPEILWKVKRSYAGSVNQFVFHGFPYSGDYGNTTWPVFTTFNYLYSNMHGPSQPAWEFYSDQFDFIARNNWVWQSGIPKMDIAFWQKITVYPGHVQARTYEPTDLEQAGYSYEYLSPDNLDLPSAKVVDGVLAPDAQGFKAFVVRANDSMTIEGATKLVEFAKAGLPIIFAGGIPTYYLGTNDAGTLAATMKALNETTSLPNIHVTSSYLVASTIASLGIKPLTKISTNATWYTYWRTDPTTNTSYIFIYNDAMHTPQGQGSSTGTIEFQSTGTPYTYNAWTGEQLPIHNYTRTNTTTTIPFTLAGNQSTIVAFHAEPLNTTATPTIKSTAAQPSFTLSNWNLTVEHWDPPSNLTNISGGAHKHNTTHPLPTLLPWSSIPGLQNVSGRGYYTATFTWPPVNTTAKPSGAYLDFGFIYHTLRARVNGHALPPLDVTDARADVGKWLVEGENVVEAVVATPLGNVLRSVWRELVSSGEGPASADAGSDPAPESAGYGLLADVWVRSYVEEGVGR